MSRFLVATPGASATRWLSFALACHPEAYVTHGKFALDSVSRSRFDEEHRQGDRGSLTRGNELRDFYAERTLDEVFAAYLQAAPSAAVHGNVHTFTIGELLQREANGESLDGIRIVNLVRHPIGFIESHTALVLSAEAQPDLREHYRRVFREAVEFCPEALLVEIDEPPEAMAFTVSCYCARQAALDLECRRWPTARMEDLTTDVAALGRFCRDVTGLEYASAELERLVRGGPINSHRAKARRVDPAAAWREWPAWRRDLFSLFATSQTFELWAAAGYDLRADLRATPAANGSPAETCLGDFSDELGLRRTRPPAVLLEENFCGFNLYEAGAEGVALAASLGEVDWRKVDLRTLAAWQHQGLCLVAGSVEVVREVLLNRPPVLVDSHGGFNIVAWRGQFAAIARWLGSVDLERLSDAQRQVFAADQTLLWGRTLDEVRDLVDERRSHEPPPQADLPQPPRLVASYNGFNVVIWDGRFAAVAQSIGPVDLSALPDGELKRIESDGLLFWGATLEQIRHSVDSRPAVPRESWIGRLRRRMKPSAGPLRWMRARRRIHPEPPRLVESRNGFNVVAWRGRFAAVAQSIGSIDLADLPRRQTKQLASQGVLLWGSSLSAVRRRVDGASQVRPEPWMIRLRRRANRVAGIPRRAASAGWKVCRRLLSW